VTAWTPTKWNHTQVTVTAQCASCHTGGYPPADGRVANHIPYATVPVAAAANCDSCHRGSTTSWANGRFHANFSVSTGCFSCHTGAYLAAVGKPATAIHANVTGNCESCHKSTSQLVVGQGRPQRLQRGDQLRAMPQRQCCDRQAGHAHPGGGEQLLQLPQRDRLDADEVEPHAGDGDGAMRELPHRQLPAGRRKRVANHIPYATVPVAAAANCDSCHRGSYHQLGQRPLPQPTSASSTGCFSCHTGATWPRWASRQRRSMPT
jgi:hypothetical protein